MESPLDTPATPKKQSDLTHDQRLQAIALRDIGWKYEQIAKHLDITIRQVQYACTIGWPTPQKARSGPKNVITDETRQMLIDFVCASSRKWIMNYDMKIYARIRAST